MGTFASAAPGDSLGTAKLVVLPLIPTGATQTFTGWFTVDSSTGLITAGSLPDQLIQIPWGEIMNTTNLPGDTTGTEGSQWVAGCAVGAVAARSLIGHGGPRAAAGSQ